MTVIDLAGRTPAQKQGLLSQLVVPRPIAMISSLNADGGLNVAPFSYYMPVCGEPPLIAVTIGAVREASAEPKDTWTNISRTGEFVVNVTTTAMAEHIEAMAREYPSGYDETTLSGWKTIDSQVVSPPSLEVSPAHLECRVQESIDRGDPLNCFSGVHIVLAEVVCITVDERITVRTDDDALRIDPTQVDVVGRMGFPWFITAGPQALFEQERIAYADLETYAGEGAASTG
jgi:flavin reductase (DIM6/NTAB) family NADH-FMN oxidoreductase RutF